MSRSRVFHLSAIGLLLATGPVRAEQMPSAGAIYRSLGGVAPPGTRGATLAPEAVESQPPPHVQGFAPSNSGSVPPSAGIPPYATGAASFTGGVTLRPPVAYEPPSRPMPSAGRQSAGPYRHETSQPRRPFVDLTVQFANDSAELTPAAIRLLDRLGQALSSGSLTQSHFRIEGHTDSVGKHEYNVTLSERRAAKAVDYLTNTLGIDRSRLEAVGLGPDHPIIPSPPEVPEPRNRRVRVVNLDNP